ncbi:MAG: cardiolipin synthase [Thermoanaerobaculia bacterium]
MATVFLVAQILGLITSIHALMTVRTAQGTIAWIVSLNTFPIAAVPAFWIFGRSKFQGYVLERRQRDQVADPQTREFVDSILTLRPDFASTEGAALAGERLAKLPYLGGNEVELLVDGRATFDSVLAGIDRAARFVLVQFYIVHDDGLGRELRDHLVARARAGVKIHFLYDEIGSSDLPSSYLESLREAGVDARAFNTTKGVGNRFQLNFRNHRKIVVVDGTEGWVGGHNVGDEYLGKDPGIGPWRDTHVRIAGPAALGLQLSFVEDWHWATGDLLELEWIPTTCGRSSVLILPSGPADRLETASLMYQEAIHAASNRIWIASPYFVPDDGVVSALHLAALRGVEVRLLIPERSDNRVVDAAAESFLDPLLASGIEIYRSRGGFLLSKHFLVDDIAAGVGTANLDNRSLRLNFEVTAIVVDAGFASRVARMFEADLERSVRVRPEDLEGRSFFRRAFTRAALLFSPVL